MASQIELIKDEPDYKLYRTSCHCLSLEDIMTVQIEADEDVVDLILYYKTKELTGSWSNNKVVRLFETILNRVKLACKVLFTGYVETEGGFMFRGTEHIDEFVKCLQKAKNMIIKEIDNG